MFYSERIKIKIHYKEHNQNQKESKFLVFISFYRLTLKAVLLFVI